MKSMWVVYAVVAAMLWGLDYTFTEQVLGTVRFSTLLSIELFCGGITMFVLAMSSGAYRTDLPAIFSSPKTLFLILLIVVVFNIANVLIVLSIGHKNATAAGLIEISYPLFIRVVYLVTL